MGKQLKISELKRVVNVDEISKYATILSDKNNQDEKQIEKILKELNTKTPSKEILMKTRLGFILKDLIHRETLSKRLRDMARDLRNKWKEFHKKLLLATKFDVKCDKPTTENRQRARQTLSNTLVRLTNKQSDQLPAIFDPDTEENKQLILDLEFTIYRHCDTLVNAKYFATVRKCIKILTENLSLRNKLLKFEMNLNQFVLENCLFNSSSKENSSNLENDFVQLFDSFESNISNTANID